MDSLTMLRKSLKEHTQGTRFGYGIPDLKGKFKMYLAQPCLPGEFRLTIVGGESGTEYFRTQPRYLRNGNASLGKII